MRRGRTANRYAELTGVGRALPKVEAHARAGAARFAARAGDVRDSQADIIKARTILGYEPTVPFDEGLRRTLEWYRTTTAARA